MGIPPIKIYKDTKKVSAELYIDMTKLLTEYFYAE